MGKTLFFWKHFKNSWCMIDGIFQNSIFLKFSESEIAWLWGQMGAVVGMGQMDSRKNSYGLCVADWSWGLHEKGLTLPMQRLTSTQKKFRSRKFWNEMYFYRSITFNMFFDRSINILNGYRSIDKHFKWISIDRYTFQNDYRSIDRSIDANNLIITKNCLFFFFCR